MCGLAGLLCSKPRDNLNRQVSQMTSNLFHRGPNNEGIWSEGCIGLGHRRLSIIDLTKSGSQPMMSNCGRFVMAYNGEIYNHLNIRKELEKNGVVTNWQGHSDTETLLEAIANWGLDEALRYSHGMFALAIWDKKKRNLSLARDRMGEKPLYWGWAGSDLIFGSELKALRAHSSFTNEISTEALSQFLRFMYVPSPRSIYTGIYKLEPGTILTVDKTPSITPPKYPIRPGEIYGNISIRRYWDLKKQVELGATNRVNDDHKALDMIEKILEKAVVNQMISDVPLGAFLSGGVDSSTIVALMQSINNKPIQTFTIGFNEAKFDESENAEAVAKHLGTNHTKLNVTEYDAQNVIPDLPWLYDEPFADSSQIPTHLVCRAARQKVTVALSGDGADELFGGYNRYIHGPKIWQRFNKFPVSLRKFIGFTAQKIPLYFWDKFGYVHNMVRTGSKGISNLGIKAHRISEKLSLINNLDDLYLSMVSNLIEPEKLLVNKVIEPSSQLDEVMPEFDIKESSTRMMFQDMRTYLPDDILCKVDRAAMGVSLETRTPFLDPDVIKLSMQLPVDMKIRNGQGKWALRQVLYRHVPKEIIDRPKEGFAIPIGLWLRGPLRDWAENLLSKQHLVNEGIFNSDIILKIWGEHLSGRKDWTNQLWTILMFQAWNNKN